MDDRRRFFRINDHVIFNYRTVQQESMEQGIMQLKSNRMGRDHIQSAMLGMETRLQDLITVVGRSRPEIADALDLLNKKISLVERMLNADRDNIDQGYLQKPSSEVSLSAGGLRFTSATAIKEGENLEVELVLLPEYSYIKAYARAVSCATEDGQEGYQIGVDFEYIREDDREAVIHHVLNKQSQLLVERRAQAEDKQDT